MAEKLIEITRGQIVESIFRGDVVVVNNRAETLYELGEANKITYMRSAAKPIQAMNVLISGAADRYKLSNQELAVICSSHYGEEPHRLAVNSILTKIGLNAENILGGVVPSLSYKYALAVARANIELTPLFSDCSGKHAGMLAVCQHKNYRIDNYLDIDNPCQQEILNIFSFFTEVPRQEILLGIDGCSAPVHALPLKNMALAFAKLSNPENLDAEMQKNCNRIFESMTENPFMVAGTDGFCSDLIKFSKGKLIGKIDAEGVYCIGVKNRNIGIALKIESGAMYVIPPVVIKLLKQLNVLTDKEIENLAVYDEPNNLNDIGTIVGKIKTVF